MNNALGGGMSSRLFQEVREKRGLAYSVYSYHAMYAEAGVFCAYAGTTPARAKEVLAIMRAELEDVANKGLGPDEFERAKGHMKGSLVLSLEDPGGRMSRLGKSEIGHGETLTVNQLLGRIDAVTAEDAARAAERVLSQPMTVTVLGPSRARTRSRDPRRRDRCLRPDGADGLPGSGGSDDFALVAAIDRSKVGQRSGR